jgi:glycosyltransferase involved in cell wall biosynthesis
MKVLFYQNPPTLNSTLLTWTLVEELRLRGHTVHYSKKPILDHYDWIHGGSINSCGAVRLSRKINAKVHIHLEGVPYWRIGLEPATNWGYPRNHTPEEIKKYRQYYKNWMGMAYEADSCSVNGKNQIRAIEEGLFEAPLSNCYMISCGADARFALTLPDWEKENYMVTVSRLEPNKKVFMIAEALVLLRKKGFNVPPWIIVGYGSRPQVDKLIEICKRGDINLRIKPCFGAEKWVIIKKARLMLQGWSGIPPAEGILCDTPVLSFDHPDIVEMYENSICYANDDNIEQYAEHLAWMLDYPTVATEITKQGKSKLLKGELYACTQEQAAEKYENIFTKF